MIKRGMVLIFLIWTGVYGNIREPLYDYISGDAFRSIADYIYEGPDWYGVGSGAPLDRRIFKNKPGDIIFVQICNLNNFIRKIHPKIKNPYILITHNHDDPIDEKYKNFIKDPKIIKWYTQNSAIEDDKLVPIPIGIENRYWFFKRTSDDQLIEKIGSLDFIRSEKIYLNITVGNFVDERGAVLDFFKDMPFVENAERRGYEDYLKDLKKHHFCISPSGNGIDCHRTWEALHMGCIPIVRPTVKPTLKEALGNNFMYEDLPVIIVKQWDEVTPEFLENKLLEFKAKKFNTSKLYFPYWKDLILSEARRYKSTQ
jgi:hypothetical protein